MSRFISTGRLADRCARRPWTTIIIWLLVAAAAVFAMTQLLADALTTEVKFTRAPESQRGLELLEDRLTGPQRLSEIVIASSGVLTVDDPEFRRQVEGLQRDITALGPAAVESTVSYYQTADASMVSADRHSTIIPVVMAGTVEDAEKNVVSLQEVMRGFSQSSGMSVVTAGAASTNNDFNELARTDGQKTETIGIAMALIILVIVFGTLVSAGLPIALAVFSIIVALGITARWWGRNSS